MKECAGVVWVGLSLLAFGLCRVGFFNELDFNIFRAVESGLQIVSCY